MCFVLIHKSSFGESFYIILAQARKFFNKNHKLIIAIAKSRAVCYNCLEGEVIPCLSTRKKQ